MPSTGAGQHGGSGQSHTSGAVKDAEHDRRMKDNRDEALHAKDRHEKGKTPPKAVHASGSQGHSPGAVKSSDDGRLKENREKGIHKGDA